MQREIGIIIRVKEAAIAKQQIKQIVDKQILDHLKRFNFQLQETGDSVGRLGNKSAQAAGGLDKFFKTAMKGAGVLYTLKRGLGLAMTSFEEGAGLERAAVQFETSIGRINEVLPSLRAATRGTVDDMKLLSTANRAVMEGLKPKELTRLYQMATVASRKLGLDSEQSIQTITNAVTRQDESALTTLGTILKMNIGLKVQNALIAKNGGVMSGAMAIQIRQAVIMGELNRKFGGFNELQEDSMEILQKFRASVGNLKMAIGQALGSALAPMLKALTMAADAAAQFLMTIKDSTAFKTFIQYSASLALIFSAKGLIRGIIMATEHLGMFIGGLKLAAILAGAFIGFKLLGGDLKDLANLAEKVKTVFSVFFQLLNNYDATSGMTSVLTKDKEALGELFTVVFQVAKVFLVLKAAATGVFDGIGKVLRAILPNLGSFGQALLDIMNALSSNQPLLQSTLDKVERLGQVAGSALAVFLGWRVISGIITGVQSAVVGLNMVMGTFTAMYASATAVEGFKKFFWLLRLEIALTTRKYLAMAAAWALANPLLVAGAAIAGVGVAAYMGVGSDEKTQGKNTHMQHLNTPQSQAPEIRSQNVDFMNNGEDANSKADKFLARIAEAVEQKNQKDEIKSLESKVQGMWGNNQLSTK